MSKKTSDREKLIEHFQQRCKERLGYILNQRFLKQEQFNKSSLVLKKLQEHRGCREFWKLKRKCQDFVLVYDNKLKCFVTIMYFDEWMANRRPDLRFDVRHSQYLKLATS